MDVDQSDDEMAPKKPTIRTEKEPTQAVNLRMPDSLVEELQDGRRVLEMAARSAGEDVPDMSKAIRRFVRIGLDATFARYGGRPKTEADWQALADTLGSNSNRQN